MTSRQQSDATSRSKADDLEQFLRELFLLQEQIEVMKDYVKKSIQEILAKRWEKRKRSLGNV
jgi:hypothetical protein